MANCSNLETLDISGCTLIDDTAFINLTKGEDTLYNLKIVNMSMLEVSDFAIVNLCKAAPNIEHLELNRIVDLTEYAINLVFNELKKLKFVDLQGI